MFKVLFIIKLVLVYASTLLSKQYQVSTGFTLIFTFFQGLFCYNVLYIVIILVLEPKNRLEHHDNIVYRYIYIIIFTMCIRICIFTHGNVA